MRRKKLWKFLLWVLSVFIVIVLAFIIWFLSVTWLKTPIIQDTSALNLKRVNIEGNFYKCGDSWLRKSESGLWEMYVKGGPFERGVKMGILSEELISKQENAFVDEIFQLIPSKFILYFLRIFIQFFDRDIDKYIPQEYLQEIYGVSRFASDKYSYIGPKYGRILNYHAAHDIGHALQNMSLVGCTSFGAWGDKSEDNGLVIGRNFDFYVGDEFAKNKIVCFVNPINGYKFAFITWAGMVGVVSGMNETGLTVTINAAKSDIPTEAKTPISILAREILQYAKNIKEAEEIAKKRPLFVSESILIGSANDGKCAIIEKRPEKKDEPDMAVFNTSDDFIICTNHFQSDEFKNSARNIEGINDGTSTYRYERVNELLNENFPLNYSNAASILRNRNGLKNKDIGMGNEKAINQLIAHHSIIFEPDKRLFWISTQPYQLGKYVCYDLNKVFNEDNNLLVNKEIYDSEYTIPPDTFLFSNDYQNFLKFKKHKKEITEYTKNRTFRLKSDEEKDFISSNPEYYLTYELLGDYFKQKGDVNKAIYYYNLALTKECSHNSEIADIRKKIGECRGKN